MFVQMFIYFNIYLFSNIFIHVSSSSLFYIIFTHLFISIFIILNVFISHLL